jgi:hypothetical protein
MSVLIETSFGDITVDIWADKAPKAALNFIKLCKMKHYNNALFIEVQKSTSYNLFQITLHEYKHKNLQQSGNSQTNKMESRFLMTKLITNLSSNKLDIWPLQIEDHIKTIVSSLSR